MVRQWALARKPELQDNWQRALVQMFEKLLLASARLLSISLTCVLLFPTAVMFVAERQDSVFSFVETTPRAFQSGHNQPALLLDRGEVFFRCCFRLAA